MTQHYLRKAQRVGGQSAIGKTVVLTDGTTHRRDKVLMVPHNTVIAPNTEKMLLK